MNTRRSAWLRAGRTAVFFAGLVACAVATGPGAAHAQAVHASVGVLAGSALPDPSLSNYQWDITPRASWGAQVLVGISRFDAGVRMLSAESTQDLGLQGVESPRVRWTAWELVGQARLVSLLGTQLHAMASAGRVSLAYSPDQLSFDPGGGGAPVTVEFGAVNEWIAGGGFALKRPIAEQWLLGLELDHRVFSMDTAHRNGGAIEYGRESFGEWNARLELAWAYGRI